MKKPLLLIILSLAVVITAGDFSIRFYRKAQQEKIFQGQIGELLALSGVDRVKEFHERVDLMRNFINKNSFHKIDAAFYATWRDDTKLAGEVIDYVKKGAAEPPHLECSTRSHLLLNMYRAAGYEARSIVVFRLAEELPSHTFVEVYDPAEKQWEIQDPDYNIYWRRIKIGPGPEKRTAISDMLGKYAAAEACGEGRCGPDHIARKVRIVPFLAPYFKIASIIDRERNERLSLYAPGVDPNATYKAGNRTGTFCALIAKNCRDGFMPAVQHPGKAGRGLIAPGTVLAETAAFPLAVK
jgi:hypothetical protein